MYVIEKKNLEQLFTALRRKGHALIGPTVKDGAIILDEIFSADSLPKGWTDIQSPASYALDRRSDDALFGYVVGPQSWKKFLYPPRLKLFTANKNGKGFDVEPNTNGAPRKYAFIGVRPCELSALKIHDEVFYQGTYADPHYSVTRRQMFIVAVNCTEPGGNCFCTSMATGPRATRAFDLSLTEILVGDAHYFVVEVGSEAGNEMLKEIEHRDAQRNEVEQMIEMIASGRMGKSLDTSDISTMLNDNFENPQWDDIAKRCMACANCTMVCPTCFCSTVEDVTDLTGDHAERWRRWDSCFTSDFTKIAGGNIRMSTRTRYRQWMMHKLGHWHEQFGTSGCVGCGRCITWCPVGIDITREAAVIRETSVTVQSN
jgi:sulfhydrogenase subunit beta (sulfur reductase)